MATLERQCQAFEAAIKSFSEKMVAELANRRGGRDGGYRDGVVFGLDLAMAMLLDSMEAEKEKMDGEDSQ